MTNNGDQTNAGGDQAIRIAITPTWEAIAKISIEALVNGTEGGQRMAREEIIDIGIKLDDAKEIIEGANPENYKKQLTRINNQVRHIDQLETMIDRMKENFGKEADDDLKYIRKLESKVEALKDDFDKGQDYIADLENQIATKNGELATLRDQIINLGEDPEYDAELANGDGQDTSIDEQVANNQPYREGDE